jgi:hypothetical protein
MELFLIKGSVSVPQSGDPVAVLVAALKSRFPNTDAHGLKVVGAGSPWEAIHRVKASHPLLPYDAAILTVQRRGESLTITYSLSVWTQVYSYVALAALFGAEEWMARGFGKAFWFSQLFVVVGGSAMILVNANRVANWLLGLFAGHDYSPPRASS